MMAVTQILMIDDDRALCELTADFLAPSGLAVEAVHSGKEGVERALQGAHALAILDVMLPDLDGFGVLRAIRARSPMPIIMLTARGQEADRIVGLQAGADDYLPKPFSARELAARIHAILRRAGSAGWGDAARGADTLVVDDVTLQPAARLVTCGSATVDITQAEFSLLQILLRAAGQVVSRDELSQQVLGRKSMPYDRSIDMHVSHLRKKLGPRGDGRDRIQSVRGVGYVYLAGQIDGARANAAGS